MLVYIVWIVIPAGIFAERLHFWKQALFDVLIRTSCYLCFFFLYSDAGSMVPYQIALRNFATVRGINIYSLRCSDQILKISDGLIFCVFHIVTTTCAWKATHFCIYIKYLNNSNKPLIHFYVLQNDRWRQHKRIIYCQLSYFTFACFSLSYSMTLAIPEKKKEIIFL